MTFVVPFDGSSLAEAALARAVEFSRVLDEEVVAVTVIPEDNASYARDLGWIDEDDDYDPTLVRGTIKDSIWAIAPEVDVETLSVDRYAPPGTIAKALRRFVQDVEATLVFLGSENAGRLVTSISSIGGRLAAGDDYDVVIVRRRVPTRIEEAAAKSPFLDPDSAIEEGEVQAGDGGAPADE